jgi:riboflavin biosynthesis pyrimidine reductase
VTPLELLYEPAGLPAFALPRELTGIYPGTLGLPEDALYVNFVETIDGVVALPEVPRSNRVISDDSAADVFVMALLRACADAVLVGSGTVRAHPNNKWTAEAAFPARASDFAELRGHLGMRPQPEIVVPSRRDDLASVIAELRERGCRRILCEGGPTLFGALLADKLVDEVFLTLSPLLAGRGLSLVEGVELLPDMRVAGTLAGVRRHGSHLFLRYLLAR